MKKVILLLGVAFLLASCALTKAPEPGHIDFKSFGASSAIEAPDGGTSVLERMEAYQVPGISIAVVVNGRLEWARGFGIANTDTGRAVYKNTLFQAGSISKPVAALAVLTLLEQNKVDLDENVNQYLKDWKIPENEFTVDEKVTLRRLLTHTAGVTVHGFPGYRQQDDFPDIRDVLDGKGNTDKIEVDRVPGPTWRYSGGGYTIMEKVVEDVSGLPFEQYMAKNVFESLGMTNSTYQQPLPAELHAQASAAYDQHGKMIDGLWNNYPEQAAAGLWTTPSDLAKYVIEIQKIHSETSTGFLSKETVDLMLTPHWNNWGLGPGLNMVNGALMFLHGGKNAGFSNQFIAFVEPKNAVIIMTNGDNGFSLIKEILDSIFRHYRW